MRVLLATLGSHGDVLPFVGLGREFRDRGHDVVLFTNPAFRDCARDVGLDFVPVGAPEDCEALFAASADGDATRAFERVARGYANACPAYVDAMRARVVAGDTIAIGNTMLFAARLVGDVDGVPCATVHLAPSAFRSTIDPARLTPRWIRAGTPAPIKRIAWWALDRFFYDPHFTAPLNRQRAALGLAPVVRIFRDWIHEADCVVGMFPELFAPPPADWPPNLVLTDFPMVDRGDVAPLPTALRDFLDAGTAPVGFTAGTATTSAGSFFEVALDACRIAGIRGVLLTPDSRQVPRNLPRDVIHVEYAAHGALLPRLAAFVHHGGIGTIAQSLRAAVPQLVRPVAYDQFDNARHVAALGVAVEILPERFTAPAVAHALRSMAADGALRERCRAVAARFEGARAIARTCDAIVSRLASMLRGGR